MKTFCLLILSFAFSSLLFAQGTNAPAEQKTDERLKTDILLVVAHPDDEAAVFSYLAKEVLDEKKRVAIVYTTRGDGGGSEMGNERGTALGMVRETEARRALASFGIYNVWFLDGHDANSQNALLSLADGQHARLLEEMVRTVRLTRPEIILTWLPALAGDHGGHQASGIVATEAFDMAGDATAFPAQLAARRGYFEALFEGLRPWQAKKIYYFTDSLWLDLKGRTAEYSSKEISPSRKVSYERLAAEESGFHLSQGDYKPIADAIAKGELEKFLRDAKAGLGFDIFPNPVRLFLGKSHVSADANGDVFEGIAKDSIAFVAPRGYQAPKRGGVSLALGGAWSFYRDFWQARNLDFFATSIEPRIYITAGNVLQVPLLIGNDTGERQEVTLNLKTKLAEGWSENTRPTRFIIEPGDVYPLQISIKTPAQAAEEWREISYAIENKGREVSTAALKVQLRKGAIPQ